MTVTIFTLLLLYQLKHYIADYPLQVQYMMEKVKPGWDFIPPLAAHCAVHMSLTFLIAMYFVSFTLALSLAIMDFVIHFIIDRIKASPNMLGRYSIEDPRFRWALGFDQMVHHITHFCIIAVILANM